METKKICRKCLLAEMDSEEILRDIKKAIDLIDANEKTSEDDYSKRLTICTSCDYLNDGTCGACGCYVELRAATKKSRCPYKKW